MICRFVTSLRCQTTFCSELSHLVVDLWFHKVVSKSQMPRRLFSMLTACRYP